MELVKTRYYKFNLFFLSLVGQWPYQNFKVQSFSRFVICVTYALFLKVQVMKFFTSEFKMEIVIEVLPFLLATMVCFVKWVTCWIKVNIMRYLLEQIEYDWTILKNEDERDILQKYTEEATIYITWYICFVYLGAISFLTVPLTPNILDIIAPLNVSRSYSLPLKAEYFVNEEKYYYPILFHMDISVVVVLTTVIASDVIFISVMVHASGILSILGYRLEHSFDDVEKENNTLGIKNRSYVRIRGCVKYHMKIMKYIEVLNSCYSSSSVVQLILTVSTITIILLRLFQNLLDLSNYGDAVISLIHVTGYFLTAFLNIVPAQKLLDHTSDIYYKSYFGYWYLAPVQTQKLLILLMQRSKVPCGITAIGILTSSFELYASVIQMSLSYFTVFYSIQ